MQAYRLGFFPMAEARDSDELMWLKPKFRGIFPLDGFHVPRSLRKVVRQDRFTVKVDTAFEEVMRYCGSEEAGREETWINEEILEVYSALHREGVAHSVESWRGDRLVGGLYGVAIQGAFFGESMFSLETDASKVALCHLVARLKQTGFTLLDTQFLTPHLARLGGIEVPSEEYSALLAAAMKAEGRFTALPDQISGSSILQAITQTS
ncbi:leucyl/phenylalanyl-tRNA--protein transferase [Parvularcula lutaonensis]|nr:leucyl/phenylalanyl-tRNA--protein transferase [Parvularcula lutaonensis]